MLVALFSAYTRRMLKKKKTKEKEYTARSFRVRCGIKVSAIYHETRELFKDNKKTRYRREFLGFPLRGNN